MDYFNPGLLSTVIDCTLSDIYRNDTIVILLCKKELKRETISFLVP